MTYTNDGIFHAFASKSATQAATPSRNIFIEGDTIYSYGYHFPMARHVDDAVLVTTDSYSITTAKQLSGLRYAINHLETFNVVNVKANNYSEHSANFTDYNDRVLGMLEKAASARNNKDYLLSAAHDLAQEANEYKRRFKIKRKDINVDSFDLNAIKEAKKLKAAKAAKAAKLARKKALAESAEKIAGWKNCELGARLTLPYSMPALLRLNGDRIETSKGAAIDVKDAPLVWGLANDCISNNKGLSVEGVKLGYYTFKSINAKGDIVVDCHKIEFTELKYIAEKIGLI